MFLTYNIVTPYFHTFQMWNRMTYFAAGFGLPISLPLFAVSFWRKPPVSSPSCDSVSALLFIWFQLTRASGAPCSSLSLSSLWQGHVASSLINAVKNDPTAFFHMPGWALLHTCVCHICVVSVCMCRVCGYVYIWFFHMPGWGLCCTCACVLA